MQLSYASAMTIPSFAPVSAVNRCCSLVLPVTTSANATLPHVQCGKRKPFSQGFAITGRRNITTTVANHSVHFSYKTSLLVWRNQKYFLGSKGTGLLETKTFTSLASHVYNRTTSIIGDQGIKGSCSDETLLSTLWNVAIASFAALCASVGIVHLDASSPKQLLYILSGQDSSEAFHHVGYGGGNGGGDGGSDPSSFAAMAFVSVSATPKESNAYTQSIASDIEVTLHQPPSRLVAAQELTTTGRQPYSKDESIVCGKPYDISVRAVKGGRVTMEDEYFVADGGRFVAVFDGHGGGGVSQYLKNHLYDAVCHHVQLKHWEENDTLSSQPSPREKVLDPDSTRVRRHDIYNENGPSVFSYAAALKSAFSEIEENVLANDTMQFQGSTAVAVLIHERYGGNGNGIGKGLKHRTLLSANIGDSRAVLSRNGQAVDLTRDHKPNDDQEKARILAMGETIEWDRVSKVHRVQNLSLSRAIGDRYAKPVVSGDVEINHFPLLHQSDEFVLLASDGLWDVMTSEEVVSFVHDKIRKELSNINVAKDDMVNFELVLRKNMAKFVTREAIRRGSSDNVCVVMVWLDKTE